jgi:hypothetical protein
VDSLNFRRVAFVHDGPSLPASKQGLSPGCGLLPPVLLGHYHVLQRSGTTAFLAIRRSSAVGLQSSSFTYYLADGFLVRF